LTTGITKKKEMMMETSKVRKTSIKTTVLHMHELQTVAYPGILFGEGGVQQIQLRTERTGIWGL
jgi:hypothetical protein